MSRRSPWRRAARLAIDLAVDLARRDGVTDPEELVVAADRAYPFGARRNHPYTIWRDEMKQLRERLRQFGSEEPAARPGPVHVTVYREGNLSTYTPETGD